MKLHAMGIGFRHDKNFRICRPDGSGDNLLVIFRTPAFVIVDGARVEVPADSAVLYKKTARQEYGAVGVEYVNDWVHFECDETDTFFERLGIGFNHPVYGAPLSAGSILGLLKLESVESVESVSDTPKSRECTDLLLRLLIAEVFGGGSGAAVSPHSDGLRRLRAEIYGSPAENYTIDELAARLSLSASYFQTLYRAEFGVSCYEDVLRAKTGLAEYYLANTDMQVREISALCGFENDVHFMRQFRKRTGLTALEYRRRAKGQQSV